MPKTKEPKKELKGGVGELAPAPLFKKTIQQVLNEFAEKHGSNWPQWSDAPLMLAAEGVTMEEVTPELLKKAEEHARQKAFRETETGKVNRPRTVPLFSLPLGTRFNFPSPSTRSGELLDLASDAKVKMDGKVEWISTHSMVVPLPSDGGESKIEQSPDMSTQEKETAMATATSEKAHEISLDDARLVGTALGNGNASGWSQKRAALKLNDLPKLMEGVDEVSDKKASSLLKELSTAIKEGKTIVVTEGEHKGNGKANPKKKGKKAEPKEKELDDWGTPVGTHNATVNTALQKAKKALTFGELCEKTGLTNKQVRYAHLNGLIKSGKIKKTEEGYIKK